MKTAKIGRATIHNMDCMDFLKGCEDNQFDLCITSPPYDQLRDYNGNISQWSESKCFEIIENLYRVMNHGAVVVWVV